jgi:hypothetical protein
VPVRTFDDWGEPLRQQFAALDPVALLKAIRDTQQELATAGNGNSQPPARATDDLSAFLDGLATAWQTIDRPPLWKTTCN